MTDHKSNWGVPGWPGAVTEPEPPPEAAAELVGVVGDRFAEALVAAAEERGYALAVAALRDDERYRTWWRDHDHGDQAPYYLRSERRHLADYLETVGPDGPDEHDPLDAPPVKHLRAAPQTWSSHLGNVTFAAALPSFAAGDRIAVEFVDGDTWHGTVAGVRPGRGGQVWIDANPDPKSRKGINP